MSSDLRRGLLSTEIKSKKEKLLNTITLFFPEHGTSLWGPKGLCFDYPVASNITINAIDDGNITSVFDVQKGLSCLDDLIIPSFNSNGTSCGLYCSPSEDDTYRYEIKIEENTSFKEGIPLYLNTELLEDGYRERAGDSISDGLADWLRSFNKEILTSEIKGMLYIDSFPVTEVRLGSTLIDIMLYTDNTYNGTNGIYHLDTTYCDIVTDYIN